jgi:hypothetical protein
LTVFLPPLGKDNLSSLPLLHPFVFGRAVCKC